MEYEYEYEYADFGLSDYRISDYCPQLPNPPTIGLMDFWKLGLLDPRTIGSSVYWTIISADP